MKVFIVTEGCYSDRDIAQVFSTNKKAEKYISRRCDLVREGLPGYSATDEQITDDLNLVIHEYEVDTEYVEKAD